MEIPDFDSPIGPRIEKARRRYNFERDTDLKWKDLGQRVWTRLGLGKVDTSKVSRIKTGEQQPSIAEGGAFAYELDCSPVWLFWEIGEMGRFPALSENLPPVGDVYVAPGDAQAVPLAGADVIRERPRRSTPKKQPRRKQA